MDYIMDYKYLKKNTEKKEKNVVINLNLHKLSIIPLLFFIFSNYTACSDFISTQSVLGGNFMNPPGITWLFPKQNGDGFPVNGSILFSTTLPVETSQIQRNAFLQDETGANIPVQVQSTGTYGFEVYPQQLLKINTRYTFTVPAGTQAVGSKFDKNKILSFSTLAVLQPVASSFGTATAGTSTFVIPEGTNTYNASVTFGKSVTGVALSPTSLYIETDSGCMNCASLSGLSGSGAGPYTFQINGLTSGTVYFLRMSTDIIDANGNSAASSIKFAVAPVVTSVKNLGSRGMLTIIAWNDYMHPALVAVDTSGNKYVAGTFFGTADWGGGLRTSLIDDSLFLIKYDAAGNYVWDRTWSLGPTIMPISLKTDSTGVYILGSNIGPGITLDTGVSLPSTGGCNDGFIIKVDSTSSLAVWAGDFHNPSNILLTASEFTPDGKLAVALTGLSQGIASLTVSPAPATAACTFNGTSLGYVTALNPVDGSCPWTTPMPVNYSYPTVTGYYIIGIGFDANAMYLTGLYFGGVGKFLSGAAGLKSTVYGGSNDIFVARIAYTAGTGPNPADTVNGWLSTFGGTGSESGFSLAVDSTNNMLYVAGSVNGSVDLGCNPPTGCLVGSAGTEDGFVAAFNTASVTPSVPVWANTIGGTAGGDRSQKVLVYNNRVRVFTKYEMTIANLKTNQFGCAFNNFNGFGFTDLVMTIYKADGTFDGARAFGSPAEELLFYPNLNFQGSYVTQDSTGKMTAVLYMGPGIIDSTPIFSSSNPRDIVMWDMQ